MKYNKSINYINNISTKTKTIILVMGLFFTLFSIISFIGIKTAKDFLVDKQKTYEGYFEKSYFDTVKNIKAFYTNRAYANLNSYGVRQSIEQKDYTKLLNYTKKRWDVLRHENKYLKALTFYDEKGNETTNLGNPLVKKLNNKKDIFDTHSDFIFKNKPVYKITTFFENGHSLSFEIDPMYFVAKINSVLQTQNFLVFEHKEKFFIISSQSNINKKFLPYLKSKQKIIEIDGKTYVKSKFEVQRTNSLKVNFIYFSNITKQQNHIYKLILEGIGLILFFAFFILIILNFGFKILIDRLEDSNKLLQKSKGKLKNLNENLQVQVSKEVEQRVKKQEEVIRANELLSQQSKLASMGEMIMNIAHQWRQPLTVVSSNLVLLELLDEKNKLTKDKLITKIHESQNQIDFMSKTIDDFRNFFKPNKNKEKFYISSAIETTLSLVKVTYKKNQIEIIKNVDENIEITNYKNEFSQVILNLLNNCNDAFISNEIANPKINISVFKKNNQVVITISDNAGGIKIEPIEKIFEPYISTKHQSLGTGIGLYMCKTIIEKNMKGFLSVKNISNGAIFEIILNEE